MSFLLKITAGKNAGSEYFLHDGKNMIGRSRSSDIRVYNEDVSGKHFSVDVADGVATLQNISGYGTRVDGVLVHKSVELHSGQVIEAGKSLKFIFEATDTEAEQEIDKNEPELTQATKFVGDVQTEQADNEPDVSEKTSVTRFADETEQTSVTGFADETEQTSVTQFASDLPAVSDELEETEQTSVTKFASALPTSPGEAKESSIQNTEKVMTEKLDNTSVAVTAFNKTAIGSITVLDVTKSGSDDETSDDKTASGTDSNNKTASETVLQEKGEYENPTKIDDTSTNFFAASYNERDEENNTAAPDDEQGMFFDDDELNESEKTSSNETQVVQTRMASMDEINFIKNQIKKQQQSRLFFKFLIFCLFVVLLGVIWMLRAPQQEKILSWPHKKTGNSVRYFTQEAPVFNQGYRKGFFDVYYPEWKNVKIVSMNPNVTVIHSFLGKNAEVPLQIIMQREISSDYVYENRNTALQNALRRLSENGKEQYNFENSPTSEFLRPAYGQSENGLLVDKLAYQRDAGKSYFGILRFFRYANTNYIVRAEVPAEEKLRALPVLNGDSFIVIHPQFVKRHWEGSQDYSKSDITKTILSTKDELQRNSPMQYPRLEREIKGILAQALYENNKKIYSEAQTLLRTLRTRQQQWYNGQKIRWFSAVTEKNKAEMSKIRNDCEAVFSIEGDKRRYDILRDYWE